MIRRLYHCCSGGRRCSSIARLACQAQVWGASFQLRFSFSHYPLQPWQKPFPTCNAPCLPARRQGRSKCHQLLGVARNTPDPRLAVRAQFVLGAPERASSQSLG